MVKKAADDAVKYIKDHFDIDLLDDDDDPTSPENNTSTIILFDIAGKKLLFTGDAGRTALNNAIEFADQHGVSLSDLTFLDVPHHGSKRNINSKILKKIRGVVAYISAAQNSPKHPAKKVTNALKKHNYRVLVTKEAPIYHHHTDLPLRDGWVPATEEPFHELVEE
jgi:beta-lactamase superfamily II metal-dependent hydrolase